MPLHPGTLRYLSAEHGIVGDLHAVSLVGIDKTIDWYCEPRFDSSCVFGALLDADHEACVPQPPSVRNQVLCIGHGQRVLVRAGLFIDSQGVRHAQARSGSPYPLRPRGFRWATHSLTAW